MSTDGSASNSAAAPSAVATSAAAPSKRASGCSDRSSATTASTRAESRPFTYATAPHSASRAAIARPMPCVDPLTNALFPDRSICIAPLSDFAV